MPKKCQAKTNKQKISLIKGIKIRKCKAWFHKMATWITVKVVIWYQVGDGIQKEVRVQISESLRN